jgi:hypothetical protein
MSSLRVALLGGLGLMSQLDCSVSKNQPKFPLGSASAARPTSAATTGSTANALSTAARGALDLGNLEFRAGRFERALKAYRDAARAAPDNAAPYFGIYMAAEKLGNAKLSDSAVKAIAARSGATPMLSDSALRVLHTAVR